MAGKKKEATVSNKICLACGKPLDDKRTIRGCHERCYRVMYRIAQEGGKSLKFWVKVGKLLPPSVGGRPKVRKPEWMADHD